MRNFDTAENDRRVANMVQMGVVEEVDYANPPRARVRIGNLLTGWLRMGTARAGDAQASWGYSIGEEVLVMAGSGDLRQGVIVCALANGTNQADAAEGTFRVSLPGGFTVEIAGGAMTITAPGDITVNGDVVADGISLVTHVHGGVIPGAADTDGPK